MTRGRAWIGVLGVLLVGIVALNVSPSASPPPRATSTRTSRPSTRRTRSCAAATPSAPAPTGSATTPRRSASAPPTATGLGYVRGQPRRRRRVAAQRLAAAGRATRGRDAHDRAPDRAPLRRLPPLLPGRSSAAPSGCRACRAPSSPPRRPTSRPKSITVPGLRGSLLDRRGNPLAASEDAATIYATPYQVKNPPQAADKLAPILGDGQGRGAESLTEESGFSYVAQQSRPADRGADRTARPAGDRPAARQPPHLPAGRDGGAGDRRRSAPKTRA